MFSSIVAMVVGVRVWQMSLSEKGASVPEMLTEVPLQSMHLIHSLIYSEQINALDRSFLSCPSPLSLNR